MINKVSVGLDTPLLPLIDFLTDSAFFQRETLFDSATTPTYYVPFVAVAPKAFNDFNDVLVTSGHRSDSFVEHTNGRFCQKPFDKCLQDVSKTRHLEVHSFAPIY